MVILQKFLAFIGSLACMLGGIYLLSFKGAGEQTTWFEVIARGIGVYFIGKGLLVGALFWSSIKTYEASKKEDTQPIRGASLREIAKN